MVSAKPRMYVYYGSSQKVLYNNTMIRLTAIITSAMMGEGEDSGRGGSESLSDTLYKVPSYNTVDGLTSPSCFSAFWSHPTPHL